MASKKTKFMKKEVSKLMDKGPSKGPLKGQKFTQKRAVAAALNVARKKGYKIGKKPADESSSPIFDNLLAEKELDMGDRKHIKGDNFVFPDKAPEHGSYPIHDIAHARNALARASAQGESVLKAVSAKVYAKYPELKAHHDARVGKDESTSIFDSIVTEGVAARTSLFDDFTTKDVDEAEDREIEKVARALTLSENLAEIRKSIRRK